jgi:hypothetical protein
MIIRLKVKGKKDFKTNSNEKKAVGRYRRLTCGTISNLANFAAQKNIYYS